MHSAPQIVAVINHMSASGKSLSAVNIAASLAASERRTLLVDLDPQANATSYLGAGSTMGRTLADVLVTAGGGLVDVIAPTELRHLEIIAASGDLLRVEVEFMKRTNPFLRLKELLSELPPSYEFMVIDTPPGFGMLTLNAMMTAHSVVIPVQASSRGLAGLSSLLSTIELMQAKLRHDLWLDGMILTQVDSRRDAALQFEDESRQAFNELVFAQTIPVDHQLVAAASLGQPALLYNATSPGAMSYLSVTKQWLRRRSEVMDTVMETITGDEPRAHRYIDQSERKSCLAL